jgi:anti-sigma factor RsiW
MQSHPEIELVPFVRGELDADERTRVQHHLDDCASCRASMDELAMTMRTVSARLEELPTPEWSAYRRELRLKLAARAETRARWWRPRVVWASLATAGVAIALFLATVMRPSMPGAPGVDQFAMEQPEAVDVGLLRNYAVVERLDLLENYDVIEHLDELPSAEHNHDSRS